MAAPGRGCLLPASPAWARWEGGSRQPNRREQSLTKIFPTKPQHRSFFVGVFYFRTGCSEIASYILLAFAKHKSGKFHFLLYFLAFPPVLSTRLYLSFDYSILNIPMTLLHTNASLAERDVF